MPRGNKIAIGNTKTQKNLSSLDSILPSTSQRHNFILRQITIINPKIVHF
ncbi:uncharacterized protein METZ01_LOCUS296660, partial [marine metagenome]